MAAPIQPGQHTALKKVAFWLVPTIADTAAPTDAEINAVGSIYLTCYVTEDYGSGWATTFNKGAGLRGLCMSVAPEVLNPSTVAGNDIMGLVDPQAAVGDDDKKALEFLRDGFTGFEVRRLGGVDNDTSDAAVLGDFVDIAPVDISEAVTDQSSNDANGVFVFKAGVAVTGAVTNNVAVVAGS